MPRFRPEIRRNRWRGNWTIAVAEGPREIASAPTKRSSQPKRIRYLGIALGLTLLATAALAISGNGGSSLGSSLFGRGADSTTFQAPIAILEPKPSTNADECSTEQLRTRLKQPDSFDSKALQLLNHGNFGGFAFTDFVCTATSGGSKRLRIEWLLINAKWSLNKISQLPE
jgi:hypothetical protein